jgi:Tol biopolymer transport system component
MQISNSRILCCAFIALNLGALAAMAANPGIGAVSLADPALNHPVGGNNDSGGSVISADGRFVLFLSSAGNLTTNDDTGDHIDIFLRNRTNNTTTLISVNRTGVGGGNGHSVSPAMSTDGRYVAFESEAGNLVANDTNNAADVFVRDVLNGTTTLVSVNQSGAGSGNGSSTSPVISADGRYVAFLSAATDLVTNDTNGVVDVFVRDLQTGTTALVSIRADGVTGGNGNSDAPAMTPDGRQVVFVSKATNLVAGVTNSQGEIYVRDLGAGTTTWASSNSAALMLTVTNSIRPIASFNPVISEDGEFVAFRSVGAASLLLRHNLQSGNTDLVSSNALGDIFFPDPNGPDMTPDGRFIAYTDAIAAYTAVYLWDGQTGTRTLVSANLSGGVSPLTYSDSPAVSSDGRFVAFLSDASDLVTNAVDGTYQVYLRDVLGGTTTLVSADTLGGVSGATDGAIPTITADGRYVAFDSFDGDYVANDNNNEMDVFVRDVTSGRTELISQADPAARALTGDGLSSISTRPVSADGRWVAFVSQADDLAPNDIGGWQDVYVRDLEKGTNTLVSINSTGTANGNSASLNPIISGNGRYVAFVSNASDLTVNNTNQTDNIYLRDLQSGTTTLVSVSADGTTGAAAACSLPAISDDGRYVAFFSRAKNLVANDLTAGGEIFWRDVQTGTTLSASANGNAQTILAMSADGRYVAWVSGFPTPTQILVWDSQAQANTYGTPPGAQPRFAFSPDGRILLYQMATNLTYAIIAHDLGAGTDRVIGYSSPATMFAARVSANGRFVAFVSPANAPDGLNGTNNIFLHDLQSDTTTLVSFNHDLGGGGDGPSDSPSISADGRFIAYRSAATDLVPGDNNNQSDVFLFDRLTGINRLISVNENGDGPGDSSSALPAISADGGTIVFRSLATDLVPGDLNNTEDVFFYRPATLSFADVDGDGLDDAWEVAHFGDLSHNGSADSDGDGATDLLEYKAGTDPMDAASSFQVAASVSEATGQWTLSWPATPGRSYRVQYKDDLSQTDWNDLPRGVGVNGPRATCVDDSTGVVNQRFYRVLLVE